MDTTILVTGATGRVGGQVVAQLAATGARVRALARDPAGVTGAEPVAGDLTRPETLGSALHGVDAVFLHAIPMRREVHGVIVVSVVMGPAYVSISI